MSDDLIDPTRTLASEAGILALEFEGLRRMFPRGPWGEAILESLGVEATDNEEQNRKKAVAECVKLGVPKEVFKDAKSLGRYVNRLEPLYLRFAEAAVASMKLPPKARIERGQRVFDRYSKLLGAVGQRDLINPAEVGALFAGHEAKTAVLRCALAVGASRTDKGFPEKLDAIAGAFGGSVPTSPYDGSPLVYEVLDKGKAFRLSINGVRVKGITLPRVDFTSASPEGPAE
jgi:hypothetical protein